MTEEKSGTQYAREVAELFREAASDCKYSGVKEKLLGLAGELETLATKLYFKTQKGTEDMQRISAELGEFKQKLAVCDQAGAESFCLPVFGKLEQLINHVKTMKVRMT